MKIRHLILALSAAGFLAATGCAGTSTQPEHNLPEQKRLHGGSSVDHVYMHRVEHHARRAGVRVQWVNPPRKRDRNDAEN